MEEFDRSKLRKVARDHVDQGEKRNRRPGECATRFCRNRTARTKIRRDGTPVHNKHCSKCLSRRWKARNPVKYFFNHLRKRARERGHAFTLTLEEWTRFVTEHDLLTRRGKTATSLSVDRKRSSLGYSYDNLTVLTVSENASKGASDDPDDGIDIPF